MTDPDTVKRTRNYIFLIFAVSILLRVLLAANGGQFYFPDEYRYNSSQRFVLFLSEGQPLRAMTELHSADHLLFRCIGIIPVCLNAIYCRMTNTDGDVIGVLFFSCFSLLNMFLISRITYNITRCHNISLWAFFLSGCSASLFYYSRHFLPYDVSMSFSLLALMFAMRTENSIRNSIYCGVLSLCAFLTYNGYWTLAALPLMVNAMSRQRPWYSSARRAVISGLSFVVPLVILLGADVFLIWLFSLETPSLLQQFQSFSQSVTHGDFREGYRLPFEHFWHAEHLLALTWLVSAVVIPLQLWKNRGSTSRVDLHERWGLLMIVACLLTTYLALAVFSVVLGKFVVYGRLARQMIPFLTVLSAVLIHQLTQYRPGNLTRSTYVFVALFLGNAVCGFYTPLTQMFPKQFETQCESIIAKHPDTEFEIRNAYYIFPLPKIYATHGTIIRTAPHPLNYLPYQFEGYGPEQRQHFQSSAINMQLVKFGPTPLPTTSPE